LHKIDKMELLTVGTVAFDDITTPFGRAEKVVGGAGLYSAIAASYFTGPVNLVSIIGGDWPKDELNALEERGIDTDGIEVVEDGKSFFWAGKYHDDMNGRDTLATELNVLADFDPILPEHFKDSKYILLGNLTPEIQAKVLDQLENTTLVVLDTMNFWMDIALDALKKVIARVDVLTINDEEARQLSGEYSLVKAAEKILTMGPKYLIIKKGEHGALLFGEGQMFFAPALPLAEVKDPTGAGDSFAGGFLGYIAKTGDISFDNMKRAIINGSAMASFCVEDFSIERIKGLSDLEINERLETFKKLSHYEL